ncbi:hypothetical protein EDD21DRAFT_162185 [Dissophora ornata]|nr:hypothetical protein EDD21DRAFT_162185 [Dissophora ornata]
MSDIALNSEAAQSTRASSALEEPLQRLRLAEERPTNDCSTTQGDTQETQETHGDHGSSQDSQYSSARASLEFSFSSLHISAEEWESLDQEALKLSSAVQTQQTMTCQTSDNDISTQCSVSIAAHSDTVSLSASADVSGPTAGHVPLEGHDAAMNSTKEDSTKSRFKFSPSVLAHHANTACEKMLHLKGEQLWAESQNQKSAGTKDDRDTNAPLSIAEATMARGIEFESRLQENIKYRVDCEAECDKDSFFRLATSADGTTLCQPIFSLDPSFYTDKMKQAGIAFGRFIPDFIRILPGTPRPDGTNKKRLYIIDAKSSSHVKISHQFQVTLYAIFLDHLIKVNGQEHLVEVDPQGGVWIPSHSEPKVFSLAFMRPIVENFIFIELPVILMKPRLSAIWHIDDPCHQCEFLSSCKMDAYEQKTLSLIPLLSKKSALWVKSLFKSSSCQSEIEDLEDLVRDRSCLSEGDRSSLAKVLRMDDNGNSPLLTSYRERRLKVLPVRTMDLPKHNQIRLLINILMDPKTLLPFAYTLESFKEQSIHPSRSVSNAIMWASVRTHDQVRLTLELVDTLYEALVQIAETRPRAPILSIFFYDNAMRKDLSTLLLRVISSKEGSELTWNSVTKSRAMDLLANMYEDASFLTLSEITRTNVKLPDLLQLTQGFKNAYPMHDRRLFSIETALRKLIVLPITGSYSFKDVLTHLVDVEAPAIIDDSDRDDNGYNLDAIYQHWVTGVSPDDVKLKLRKWSEQQNIILISLYALVRKEHGDLSSILLAPQAPFKMRCHFNIQHNILAQFAFFQQWETIILAEKRRQIRISLTRDEAMRHQYAFRCRFLRRHVGLLPNAQPGARARRTLSDAPSSEYIGMFEVTSRLEPGELVGDTFKKWILARDDPSGLDDRMRFNDLGAILRAFGRGSPAIISVSYYDSERKIAYLSGAFSNMTDALRLTEGEYYVLERREFCPTLTNSMAKLIETNENCRLFLELMEDPNKWGEQRPARSADVFLESITNSTRQYDMTLSQEQAFSKVINNRLQVIWGPPGSGKTHFLALTILRFIDILGSLSEQGKGQGPYTIVLTAFTHAAINNLVARIASLQEDIAPHQGAEKYVRPLVLYRLGDPSSMDLQGVTVVEPAGLAKIQSGREDVGDEDIVRIVCGTVWQIRRAAHPKTGVEYMRNIQMLIIDEGSQLLAADSIHAIECLDPEQGRLVVAGDHLQLGPVILGDYPSSDHAPDPTGSIMRNLMRTRGNTQVSLQWIESGAVIDIGPCTSQLQDNFRMNRQLGAFMQSIYGPNYQVRTPGKTLPYGSGFRGSAFPAEIRRILDPDRSAICIELQLTDDNKCLEAIKVRNDSRAAAYLEATFVAGIVEYYLELVGQDTSTSLFVVVPHHTQRLAILDKIRLPDLKQKYPMAQVKVDTVEKMQGQEADMVVVCFALFDEFALVNELGYLYSVHRWIVALSRARCKTVLLMSPQLKSPRIIGGSGKVNPVVLESLDGWGFLQAYEKYAQKLGGKLKWPITQEFLKGIGLGDF